jgi:NH3-dependent NAD+ synthetase
MSSQLGGLQNQAFKISGGIVSAVSAATVVQAVGEQALMAATQKLEEEVEAAKAAAGAAST